LDDARHIITDLLPRLEELPYFVSDELSHYKTVLAEELHHLVTIPPTGKRGRPPHPVKVIDPRLDYATVKKTRERGKIVKVEREIVFGSVESIAAKLEHSPSQTINTSYIERSNLDWRLWDAHLVRKSPTFAKSLRWLRAKLSICLACYNLIRPHKTLSARKNGKPVPTTPAMAANITKWPWDFYDILAYQSCVQQTST
jgi:hypothetical protein